MDKQSDGSQKIWNKANSNALDNGSKSGNNIPLIQWDWNGGRQQRWNVQSAIEPRLIEQGGTVANRDRASCCLPDTKPCGPPPNSPTSSPSG